MGGFSSFRVHLEELIRARTPLFYVGSVEIKRCLEEARLISARLGAEIRVFNLSRGILEGGGDITNSDPISVLDTIMKRSKNTSSRSQTLWILPFFHLLLQPTEALIISKLRDIVEFNHLSEELGCNIAQSVPRLLPWFLEGPLVLVELAPGLGSGISNKVIFFLVLVA